MDDINIERLKLHVKGIKDLCVGSPLYELVEPHLLRIVTVCNTPSHTWGRLRKRYNTDDYVQDLLNICVVVNNANIDGVLNRSRKTECVRARQMFFYFLLGTAHITLKSAGSAIDGVKPFDHSTVIHAKGVMNDYLDTNNRSVKSIARDVIRCIAEESHKYEHIRSGLEHLGTLWGVDAKDFYKGNTPEYIGEPNPMPPSLRTIDHVC